VSPPFTIEFEDDHLLAIHKPYGWFVHSTALDRSCELVVMPLLRDYVGHYIYPAHRIDRKTSGVLLFSKNEDVHVKIRKLFENQLVIKEYHAIVRGFVHEEISIDYHLTNDRGKVQDASTEIFPIAYGEIPLSSGKHATSRYSLIKAIPKTGRQHQIRKHLKHIFHPILGDRPHGCNKQNRFLLQNFGLSEMLLHARSLSFRHPITDAETCISSAYSPEFSRMLHDLDINTSDLNYTNHTHLNE